MVTEGFVLVIIYPNPQSKRFHHLDAVTSNLVPPVESTHASMVQGRRKPVKRANSSHQLPSHVIAPPIGHMCGLRAALYNPQTLSRRSPKWASNVQKRHIQATELRKLELGSVILLGR